MSRAHFLCKIYGVFMRALFGDLDDNFALGPLGVLNNLGEMW